MQERTTQKVARAVVDAIIIWVQEPEVINNCMGKRRWASGLRKVSRI